MKTATETISRNSACWCGSGKKYKKCHIYQDRESSLNNLKLSGKMKRERQIIIKTEEQIEGIRKSCKMTKDLLDMLEEKIEEGITTNKINECNNLFILRV